MASGRALPDDWLAHCEQLLDTPVESPNQSLEGRRLRQAKARLDDIYSYSDMSKAECRRRKGDLDRQLRQLAPPQPKQRIDAQYAELSSSTISAHCGHTLPPRTSTVSNSCRRSSRRSGSMTTV